jgi:hypothetical protein
MGLPNQAQINSALRSVGVAAGTTASVFVLLGALSPDQSTAALAAVHQILDGAENIAGGFSKLIYVIGPVVVLWCAKWGINAQSLQSILKTLTEKHKDDAKIEGKIVVSPDVAAAVPSSQVVSK